MAVKSTIQNRSLSGKALAGKVKLSSTVVSREAKPERKEESPRDDKQAVLGVKPKKVCYFCESKTEPSYTDAVALRKFMNDRAKIVAKMRTGACSKHQRRITIEIKHARHLALLPFVPSV